MTTNDTKEMNVMETPLRTAKTKLLAKTIMDDLEALLSTSISYQQPGAGIAEALKENADKITCFSDLHDYMDANRSVNLRRFGRS